MKRIIIIKNLTKVCVGCVCIGGGEVKYVLVILVRCGWALIPIALGSHRRLRCVMPKLRRVLVWHWQYVVPRDTLDMPGYTSALTAATCHSSCCHKRAPFFRQRRSHVLDMSPTGHFTGSGSDLFGRQSTSRHTHKKEEGKWPGRQVSWQCLCG